MPNHRRWNRLAAVPVVAALHRRWNRLAAVPVVAALTLLAWMPAPAHASGTAVNAGWYLTQPITLDLCSKAKYLASGSDGQPMYAYMCVTRTGTLTAQPVVIFDNRSRSSATAVASYVQACGLGEICGGSGSGYTCGGKTLGTYGTMYCVGYNHRAGSSTTASSWYAMAEATVNGYGGRIQVTL